MHFDGGQHGFDGMREHSMVFSIVFRVVDPQVAEKIAREHAIESVEKGIETHLDVNLLHFGQNFDRSVPAIEV